MDTNNYRKLVKRKRKELSSDDRYIYNEVIYARLIRLLKGKKFDRLFTYVSLPDEVDTTSLINYSLNEGIITAVPKVLSEGVMSFYQITSLKDLEKGSFNVDEPRKGLKEIQPTSMSIIIVPGVVFDEELNRIGYGGGYYDRYLNSFKATKIALAYSCQIVKKIISKPHDIPMDYIMTEKKIIQSKWSDK